MVIMFILISFGLLYVRLLKFTGDTKCLTAYLGSTDRNNLNLSTEWTINVLPASEIDKIVLNPLQDFSQETLEDGSSLQNCKDLEAFLKSQNATYTEGELTNSGSARFSMITLNLVETQNIIRDCNADFLCRNSLERGFPPLEFFFLLFYLLLIILQEKL